MLTLFAHSVVFFLIILTASCGYLQSPITTADRYDISNRGYQLMVEGRFSEALEYHEKALSWRRSTFGPNHPLVAKSLYEIGVCYYYLGEYEKAENYLLESLAIREKVLGANHMDVAKNLIRLADIYRNLGDLEKAEPLYKRSLAISEKVRGPQHLDVAWPMTNLAVLYFIKKDFDSAESLFKKAVEIREKALGKTHGDVGVILHHWSKLLYAKGDYTNALSLGRRSLDLQRAYFGSDHPFTAITQNYLAKIYLAIGDFPAAKSELNDALSILQKRYGEVHPEIAVNLANQVKLFAKEGNFTEATLLLKKLLDIDERLIQAVMGFTSEKQKMIYIAGRSHSSDLFLSIAQRQLLNQEPFAREDALTLCLKRKGIALETQRLFQEKLIQMDDPKTKTTFQELSKTRTDLSALVFGRAGFKSPEDYHQRYNELEAKRIDLEELLIKYSQRFSAYKRSTHVDAATVAGILSNEMALVEIVKVSIYDFEGMRLGSDHYLAFILSAGEATNIGMADLGRAEEIEQLVSQYKTELFNPSTASNISRALYLKIFNPLKSQIGEAKKIFISPDGELNLIPFEILQDENGRYLIEDYTFNYLATGRDIISFNGAREATGKAILMGDPDFEMAAQTGEEEKTDGVHLAALDESIQEPKNIVELRGINFQQLPGTREEVKSIQTLLGSANAEAYVGREATENVLMQQKSPSILHLATHGFFLSDQEMLSLETEFSGGSPEAIDISTKGQNKRVRINSPLLRSGIILAGANKTIKTGLGRSSEGILTAEKILSLDLTGTEMVVLSACETGVGESRKGEGVFGLRRAFTQAGAKSIVMSMWPVPDIETKELMVEFYKNIQSGKMNRCQALRQAALKQMQIAKERYGSPNPLYWGAFIFLGEP